MEKKIENRKELDKKLKSLVRLFKYNECRLTFGKATKSLGDAFKLMRDQLGLRAEGESVSLNKQQSDRIERGLSILIDVAITKPITNYFNDFATEFLRLISNWNIQVGKNPRITRNVQLLNRLLTSSLTMKETINVLQMLLQKLRAEMRYVSPAFKLSKHYLQSLEGELESGKEENALGEGKPKIR